MNERRRRGMPDLDWSAAYCHGLLWFEPTWSNLTEPYCILKSQSITGPPSKPGLTFVIKWVGLHKSCPNIPIQVVTQILRRFAGGATGYSGNLKKSQEHTCIYLSHPWRLDDFWKIHKNHFPSNTFYILLIPFTSFYIILHTFTNWIHLDTYRP